MSSRPGLVATLVAITLGVSNQAADAYIVPGTAGPGQFVTVGTFAEGTVLTLTATGSVELVGGTGFTWRTYADGSLEAPVTFPAYLFANVGATNYPTVGGGDGVNHFAGGGANFDTAIFAPNGPYGFAGAQTTDTLAPGVICFGAIVGTFADNPTRGDWFLVGRDTTVTAPAGGGTLRLAVHDSNNTNNLGAYAVEVQVVPVPEPASGALFAMGVPALIWLGVIRRRHVFRTTVVVDSSKPMGAPGF